MKSCCANAQNLLITSIDENKLTKTCKVCECRHIELTVEAGKIGISLR